MRTIILTSIAVCWLAACTEQTPEPAAKTAPQEHFASDLERSLDKAKAVQGQLEEVQKARLQGTGQTE